MTDIKSIASGARSIFALDILAGAGLAIILDWILAWLVWHGYFPGGRPIEGQPVTYDDMVVIGIEVAGALLTKGRLRRIFVYALCFTAFLKACFFVERTTGNSFM
jgi:hypothetical protein